MGGGGVSVPEPSAEERALQAEQANQLKLQTEILRAQQAQQKVLLPFLADQEGYDVTMDDNGNITAISKRDDPLDQQNKEITGLLNERTLKALKGELPLDPALEESLTSQEQQLRERLTQQFGTDYETSSPAIETLAQFMRQSEILREGARTGALTLGEQLGITRQQQDAFTRQTSQDNLRQFAFGDPLTMAGAHGQVARGYGAAQQPYQNQRNMQFQAANANANRSMGLVGAGIGLIGSLFSDPDMKEGLIPVGETQSGFTIYEYTRKDTGERMLGVMADEVEAVLPELVGEKGGYDVVNYGGL